MTAPIYMLACDRVLTPGVFLEPGWISWQGSTIIGVGEGPPPRPADVELPGRTVTPGFIDTHVHGGGGGSFSEHAESARQAVMFHRRHGTTTMLASLVSDSVPNLLRTTDMLRDLVTDGDLAGVHLEGPWLSAERRGAHAAEWLSEPDPASVRAVLAAGQDVIRVVTLAPELPGGIAAIRAMVDAGVRAAIGHTSATYEEASAAIDAGASIGTHVFNAMPLPHHRRPGPAAALMERAEVYVEAVADGHHLHPAMIRQLRASPAQLVLVSDAIAATGQPDGVYSLGDVPVCLHDGLPRVSGTQVLAGSTLTMGRAIAHSVKHAGIDLRTAVTAATATPAALLGRADVGAISVGARADLVVLDDQLEVTGVLAAGRWQTEPPNLEPQVKQSITPKVT